MHGQPLPSAHLCRSQTGSPAFQVCGACHAPKPQCQFPYLPLHLQMIKALVSALTGEVRRLSLHKLRAGLHTSRSTGTSRPRHAAEQGPACFHFGAPAMLVLSLQAAQEPACLQLQRHGGAPGCLCPGCLGSPGQCCPWLRPADSGSPPRCRFRLGRCMSVLHLSQGLHVNKSRSGSD